MGKKMKLSENESWLLSFYRNSEITGALFFGRLAQYIPEKEIRVHITKHFADEAQHAWYWTKCIQELGEKPMRLKDSYQDRYFEAIGAPMNMMEILAITQIFEKRVIDQYNSHLHISNLNPVVAETFKLIMKDEAWHIKWVGESLHKMEGDYGKDRIASTLKRFKDADDEVYGHVLKEHQQRLDFLIKK
jgi:rubrerythrin